MYRKAPARNWVVGVWSLFCCGIKFLISSKIEEERLEQQQREQEAVSYWWTLGKQTEGLRRGRKF